MESNLRPLPIYRTETPQSRWYQETVTLAEHQMLKRVRQLCREGSTIVVLEIIDRHEIAIIE